MGSRTSAALKAMKKFGFPPEKVKRALKNLLKVFDNNWVFIEAENYSALADAVLDLEESKDDHLCQQSHSVLNSERTVSEPPSKRQKHNVDSCNQVCLTSEATPPHPIVRDRQTDMQKHNVDGGNRVCLTSEPIPPQPIIRDRQTDIVPSRSNLRTNSPHVACRSEQLPSQRVCSLSVLKEPKTEPDVDDSHRKVVNESSVDKSHEKDVTYPRPSDLVQPKPEPFTGEFPSCEVPIAVIYPDVSSSRHISSSSQCHVPCPARQEDPCVNGEKLSRGSRLNVLDAHTSDNIDAADEEVATVPGQVFEQQTNLDLVPESGSSFTGSLEIASSSAGEVKLSLACGSLLDRPGFHVPNIDEVLKLFEEKCLKSYRIVECSFSFKKLMKEFCQAFLELGCADCTSKLEEHGNDDCTNKLEERQFTLTTDIDALKKFNLRNVLSGTSCLPGNIIMSESALNGLPVPCSYPVVPSDLQTDDNSEKRIDTKWKGSEEPNPSSLDSDGLALIPHHQFSFGDMRPLHDVKDISKGEEKVQITIVNEVSSEEGPPTFHYIPRNIVYQNAYVNFSLARIGHEDCCADCFMDCLASSIPCACARETGGEFAYTTDGLVKKEFLEDCISMNQNPHKHRLFYCRDCPIERSKNDVEPERCKGHVVRKFIKECWSKCGCSMQCGNRVVQRGITRNLQVFLTSQGKGWGLRTLEDLPRGSFVCEYVGEILTNTELYERNARSSGNDKHTYPVLLDADWGSEGVLKDEEALCLDATFYGNVARFINHRCSDANLIEIPVEVETPDRHYYHLAFFTTSNVKAFEELTWDYAIDFDDVNHPVKAFRCRCGSKFCRDLKRSSRAKRLSSMSSMPTPKSTVLVLR